MAMATSTISYSWSDVRQRIIACAPERYPFGWLMVNLVCLVATSVTLGDMLIATDDLSERPRAAALYLVWNFGTTIIWLVEVGLSIALLQSREQERRVSWEKPVELILAIYFTFDSLHLLWKWKVQKQDIEEELFDVSVNLLGFLFISYDTYTTYRKESLEDYSDHPVGESTALVV